jgi:4-hydroxy-tetrahydrodipicolinate synthase
MNKILFEGCATALVTPFRDGAVDFPALKKLIEHQIAGGVKALVVLGTTGEPSTLSASERTEIIKFARIAIAGRALMIVGTGANDTTKAIEQSLTAKKLGADGLLVVTPYYNKCTQRGLVAYYNAIADAAQMPIIAYNVPARTGLNMTAATAAEISKNPHIVGLKEASENLTHITAFAHALHGKMALYSGDDEANLFYLTLGAHGMISVAANVLPAKVTALYDTFKSRDTEKAAELHDRLYDVCSALFCEVNPIPVKAALAHIGICTDELRAPLTTIEDGNRQRLTEALKKVI